MKQNHVLVIIAVFALSFFILTCVSTSPSTVSNVPDELDMILREVSDYLNESIPEGKKIAIINIQSGSTALTDYIIDELISNAVNDRNFSVVDRQQLDAARTELNFNMSGEVSDQSAQSVGQMLGAQTIITGRVSQIGERYRLNIRALEVETVQVQGSNNWNIAAGATITTLMRSVGGSGGTTQSNVVRTTGSSTSNTGTTGGTNRVVPTITSVTISPDSISVDKGSTQQFEAIVTGNNDPDLTVTWTVSGHTSSNTIISDDGILTVGNDENITPIIVTATSTFDRSKNNSATVIVPGGISAINVSSTANWNSAINRIRNGGNNQTYIINVTGNVSVPAPPSNENIFGSVTGLNVIIQGNGTLSLSVNGTLLRIAAGQTVTIRNVTLQGRKDNDNAVVRILSGGIFNIEGNASIRNNTGWRGSVGVIVDGGTFIMHNGTISGNSQGNDSGGGVRLNGGTFIMQGGTISGNSVGGGGQGAGVFITSSGNFTMEGGTISGNNGAYGGGVSVENGTFVMEGGTISGNSSNNEGGGVRIWHGTFTMKGGSITGGNNSRGNGAGVFIGPAGQTTFNKTGGTISGNDVSIGQRNTSSGKGHAIYFQSSPERWRNATAEPDDTTSGFGFYLND